MFLDVHSHKPQPQQAVQAGPGPGLGGSSGAKGVFARVLAEASPPAAASERQRPQIKEWRFQAKAGRASWQSVSGLCNYLLGSSKVEDFALLF